MKIDPIRQLQYRGTSMYPVLKVPDMLVLDPLGKESVEIGDVVVFHDDTGKTVVHRVVGLEMQRVITQGDNNSTPDEKPPVRSSIIGKVVAAKRGSRSRPVYGGTRGIFLHHMLQARKKAVLLATSVGGIPYRLLAESGCMRCFLPTRFKPRIYRFTQPEGEMLHLYIGSLLVGRKSPRNTQWIIRRPFKLFIDMDGLPEIEHLVNPRTP